jgi:hypothetical protein
VLPGDLALRSTVQAAYQHDHLPAQEEALAIAGEWRLYRSLATSCLFSRRLRAGLGANALPTWERFGMNDGCMHLERIPRCHALVRAVRSAAVSWPVRSGAGTGICGIAGRRAARGCRARRPHERGHVFVPASAPLAVKMISATVWKGVAVPSIR